MKDFYLNLCSKSSVFNTNTGSEFTVSLRPPVYLSGSWTCAVTEMLLPKATTIKVKCLLANFIQSSVVGETRRPALRVFFSENQHLTFTPEYIPVTDQLLDTLVFELVDEKGNNLALSGETYLRLHFKQW